MTPAQVQLTAGSGLGAIGLKDDRIVPALCRAAHKANDLTREGVGFNILKLRWDAPSGDFSAEAWTRRFQTAVRELKSLLDRKESAAHARSCDSFCELAVELSACTTPHCLIQRGALERACGDILDENEELSLRLHAMNQWVFIRPDMPAPARGRRPVSDSPAPRDELHAPAAWLAMLARSLASPAVQIRSRPIEILVDSVTDPHADDWYRDAWRKIVPDLAKATASEDNKVRGGSLALPGTARAIGGRSAWRPGIAGAEHSGFWRPRGRPTREIESISSVDRLNARDPKIRIAAAETLGRLGSRTTSAVPALTAAIKDPETDVRLAATNALRALGARAA